MNEFQQRADHELEKTRSSVEAFPWQDRDAYAMWLVQTYHMVNHSTRLVALAGAYAPLDKEGLHNRFVDHSREERGHPHWCIDDLTMLGKRIDDYPCLYQSACLYQIQYYWIQHRGASSFFGYTLSLECLAEKYGRDVFNRVAKAYGEAPTKFLKGHAEEDIDHVAKAWEQVKTLSCPEQEIAWENFVLSATLYRSMLNEIPSYLAWRHNNGEGALRTRD
jgi:hypothetical protein